MQRDTIIYVRETILGRVACQRGTNQIKSIPRRRLQLKREEPIRNGSLSCMTLLSWKYGTKLATSFRL
jgi:hypothetical protein